MRSQRIRHILARPRSPFGRYSQHKQNSMGTFRWLYPWKADTRRKRAPYTSTIRVVQRYKTFYARLSRFSKYVGRLGDRSQIICTKIITVGFVVERRQYPPKFNQLLPWQGIVLPRFELSRTSLLDPTYGNGNQQYQRHRFKRLESMR